MDLNRAVHRVGLTLMVLCMVYGILILLIFRSFTATIVPFTQGREVPEPLNIVVSVVAMFLLIAVVPGTLFKMTSKLQERLPKLGSWAAELVLLILALGALARGVWRIPTVVSGNVAVMPLVTEVWFIAVGILGVALWAALQGCRRQLRRHAQGEELPWDQELDASISAEELMRRRHIEED